MFLLCSVLLLQINPRTSTDREEGEEVEEADDSISSGGGAVAAGSKAQEAPARKKRAQGGGDLVTVLREFMEADKSREEAVQKAVSETLRIYIYLCVHFININYVWIKI